MGSPRASTTSLSSSSSSSAASNNESRRGAHVLLLPVWAAQSHNNPMLQFGRRLAYHGLCPTLAATTRYVLSTTVMPPPSPFRVAAISDGFNDGGMAACPDLTKYWRWPGGAAPVQEYYTPSIPNCKSFWLFYIYIYKFFTYIDIIYI
ncbi:hypothetical protein BAE44_0025116 [Dichanthelium oligosanthes]|uniref:Uncharacterized protein n=1 Tax=Dichanthelium oligosanthes TaxID=888268 RepID=A0A1E5ULW1_9POAL|nr:hypothetical protein BAE44_0025116 [Dichanthelium oligosanthes]